MGLIFETPLVSILRLGMVGFETWNLDIETESGRFSDRGWSVFRPGISLFRLSVSVFRPRSIST